MCSARNQNLQEKRAFHEMQALQEKRALQVKQAVRKADSCMKNGLKVGTIEKTGLA